MEYTIANSIFVKLILLVNQQHINVHSRGIASRSSRNLRNVRMSTANFSNIILMEYTILYSILVNVYFTSNSTAY